METRLASIKSLITELKDCNNAVLGQREIKYINNVFPNYKIDSINLNLGDRLIWVGGKNTITNESVYYSDLNYRDVSLPLNEKQLESIEYILNSRVGEQREQIRMITSLIEKDDLEMLYNNLSLILFTYCNNAGKRNININVEYGNLYKEFGESYTAIVLRGKDNEYIASILLRYEPFNNTFVIKTRVPLAGEKRTSNVQVKHLINKLKKELLYIFS